MTRAHRVRRSLALVLLLSAAATARASDLSDDLSARRARLMERLGADAMLIVTSAPTRLYSLDITYEYRQDSNLYYLTGIAQEETMLVLMPGNVSAQGDSVRQGSKSRARALDWPLLSPRRSEREERHRHGAVHLAVRAVPGRHAQPAGLRRRIDDTEAARSSTRFRQDAARLAVPLDAGAARRARSAVACEFAQRLRDGSSGFRSTDAAALLTRPAARQDAVRAEAAGEEPEISSEAQIAGMRAARPGAYEYEVKAAIEAVHRGRGACRGAIPRSSAAGRTPRSSTIRRATGRCRPASCCWSTPPATTGTCRGDITRTYPVQRHIHAGAEGYLRGSCSEAQEAGMKAAQAGRIARGRSTTRTVEVIKAGLLKLGLITDTTGDQYRMWYTHGASHYIGIDVHDVGERTRRSSPGMAFTIEPGIYIRQSALDALPRTTETSRSSRRCSRRCASTRTSASESRTRSCSRRSGLRGLSAAVPRTIDEIEAFMRKRPATFERPVTD